MRRERRADWFRGLFVAVMLAVCALLAFSVCERQRLLTRIADLTISLETSRGREARQTHEYDEAVAALPVAQAELARVSPLTEAAEARERELRQQRKDIRAEIATLETQIGEARDKLAVLTAQADALRLDVQRLDELLSAP